MSDLPPGWTLTTLGDVCDPPQYGWTTSARKDGSAGLRFLRTTDISGGSLDWSSVPFCAEEPPNREHYQLAAGDIVISRAGSVGFSYRLTDTVPAVFASYLIRFRPSMEINGRYLSLYLQSRAYWDQIAASTSGITLANVNAKKLAAIALPLAPLPEQERIVGAVEEQFSRVDAGQAGLERVRRNIKRMRAAAYLRIDEAAGELVASLPLTEHAEFIVDGDHNPPKRVAAGIPYLTAKHVKNGRVSTEDTTFVSATDFEILRRRYDPRPGDVLVTCVGTLGQIAVVPGGLTFAADRNLAAIRPTGAVNPAFLASLLRSPRQQKILAAGSGSTAQPHLYLKDLRAIAVPVPEAGRQEALLAELETELEFIARIEAVTNINLARIGALRSSILIGAFSGRLVHQDSNDEPAPDLLERIAGARTPSNGDNPPRRRMSRASRAKVPE